MEKNKRKVPLKRNWVPIVGNGTKELQDYFQNEKNITKESCDRLKEEAVKIL